MCAYACSSSPSKWDGMVSPPGVSTVASVLSFDVVLGADRILNVTSDLIGDHCIAERSDSEMVYVHIKTLDIDLTGFTEHVDH